MRGQLLVVVGPTASGKTALALTLAQRFGGEIIAADSRTLYRGLDIGTAKPTWAEREAVPHHLLDLLDPGEPLSAAAFKRLAEAAMTGIWSRGRLPILVGGSGLYIDAVVFDYQFPAEADPAQRKILEAMSLDALVELLAARDEQALELVDLHNRRRVIRAVETAGQPRARLNTIRPQVLMLGLTMNKKVAQERIQQRIEKMLEQGFLREVEALAEQYGWDSPAFEVIGYRAFKDVVRGTKTVGEGAVDFARGDLVLYKKQVTWFKRNPAIRWLQAEEASRVVADFLRPN